MGHDSERAAMMIYQHQAHGADNVITNAIDTRVQAEQARRGNDEDDPTGVLVPAGEWPGQYPMTLDWSVQGGQRGR